jgi:hypothetical protein
MLWKGSCTISGRGIVSAGIRNRDLPASTIILYPGKIPDLIWITYGDGDDFRVCLMITNFDKKIFLTIPG